MSAEPPADFAEFYRCHLPWVVAWLHRHVRDRELAADLAGEVFAAALQARDRFVPGSKPEPWLQAIARNVLIDSVRRGRVEDRARRAMRIARLPITDDDLARVDELIDQARGEVPALLALEDLPPAQRDAVRAHVIGDEGYAEIGLRLECSTSVVRQRVSRGLRSLRGAIEGDR